MTIAAISVPKTYLALFSGPWNHWEGPGCYRSSTAPKNQNEDNYDAKMHGILSELVSVTNDPSKT